MGRPIFDGATVALDLLVLRFLDLAFSPTEIRVSHSVEDRAFAYFRSVRVRWVGS